MANIDKNGYICVRTISGRPSNAKSSRKNTWLVKYIDARNNIGRITMKNINIPKEYVGKRVRFKMEVVGEEKKPKVEIFHNIVK
jgi:hypothetical protein